MRGRRGEGGRGREEGRKERGGHYSLLGEMTIKVHSATARSSFLSSCTQGKDVT